MADTQITVSLQTAGAVSPTPPGVFDFYAMQDIAGNVVLESQPRVNGAAVASSNPMPSSDIVTQGYLAAMVPGNNTPVASTALGASLVLKNSGCRVTAVQAVATAIGGYVLLIDAATVPAAGPVTPIRAWPVTPNVAIDRNPACLVLNGAVLLFSTAPTPFTYTPSATAYFVGETT